jgi:hypothetical protein
MVGTLRFAHPTTCGDGVVYAAYSSARTNVSRGPIAVEVCDEALQIVALHRAIERGFVGELISRLMQ